MRASKEPSLEARTAWKGRMNATLEFSAPTANAGTLPADPKKTLRSKELPASHASAAPSLPRRSHRPSELSTFAERRPRPN